MVREEFVSLDRLEQKIANSKEVSPVELIWWDTTVFETFDNIEIYIFGLCSTIAFCLVLYGTKPIKDASVKENAFRRVALAFLAETVIALIFSYRFASHIWSSGLPPDNADDQILFYGLPFALFSLLWIMPLIFSIALKFMERSERKHRLWSRIALPDALAGER